jgi:hypothetical protein
MAMGLVIGLVWGAPGGLFGVGLLAGALLGCGLGLLIWARPAGRKRRHPLASWRVWVANALLVCGGLAMALPVQLFGPTFLVQGISLPGASQGIRVYSDLDKADRDATLVQFIDGFQRAFSKSFFPVEECPVDVHVIGSPHRIERLQGLGIDIEIGATYDDDDAHPTIVVQDGNGLGRLTHHLAKHYLACMGKGDLHPWIRHALATHVEVFVATQDGQEWHFSFGYRDQKRFPSFSMRFDREHLLWGLLAGQDRSMHKAFGLFLHEKGWLVPLINEAAPYPRAGHRELRRLTGMGHTEMATTFEAWLKTDARAIPMMGEAFIVTEGGRAAANANLNEWYRWDVERSAWRAPTPAKAAIPLRPLGPLLL